MYFESFCLIIFYLKNLKLSIFFLREKSFLFYLYNKTPQNILSENDLYQDLENNIHLYFYYTYISFNWYHIKTIYCYECNLQS